MYLEVDGVSTTQMRGMLLTTVVVDQHVLSIDYHRSGGVRRASNGIDEVGVCEKFYCRRLRE